MGIARHLSLDCAQPETLGRIIARLPDPAIVQDQRLGSLAFQKKLAILGPRQRLAQHGQCFGVVQPGFEGAENLICHRGTFLRRSASLIQIKPGELSHVSLVRPRTIWFHHRQEQRDSVPAFGHSVRAPGLRLARRTTHEKTHGMKTCAF